MLMYWYSSRSSLPSTTHGPGSRTKWKVETLAVDFRLSFVQTQESRHKSDKTQDPNWLPSWGLATWSMVMLWLHGTDMALSWWRWWWWWWPPISLHCNSYSDQPSRRLLLVLSYISYRITDYRECRIKNCRIKVKGGRCGRIDGMIHVRYCARALDGVMQGVLIGFFLARNAQILGSAGSAGSAGFWRSERSSISKST